MLRLIYPATLSPPGYILAISKSMCLVSPAALGGVATAMQLRFETRVIGTVQGIDALCDGIN